MTQDASTGATRALADFAATISFDAIPQMTRSRMKECFLDFIGNSAFAAREAESSPAFRRAVRDLALGIGPGTVVGESRRYPLQYAALLNGAYAHTLDFDDTSLFGSLHPGAVVIPAALAEAERTRASGRQFIEALAVGNEIACRVGAAVGATAYDRGFHNTPVAGIFGAVAAAGRLRGLDSAAIANAFGLAGSRAAGSMQYLENGAWNKRLHPGLAAHDALVALAFAQAGAVGATAAIEGRYGLLTAYSNAARPELLTDRLGQWWAAGEIAIKPYPSCRLTHSAIDAGLMLRERVIGMPGNVDLDLSLSSKAVQVVGEALSNKVHARNVVDGQFSVYFQLAVAWLDGRCDWSSYKRLGMDDVDALASRIAVRIDESLPVGGAILSVRGIPELTVRVDEPLGEPSRPLQWQEMVGKYSGLAESVYGLETTREIARRINQLEDEPAVTGITNLLLLRSTS
ncbi:MAG TPA: MmgE/PrpD family protein [Noviherbaspirillum sp.]|uniref:MmgE/PrpD family protein n=1 Tax=Noviherbaspirillum sp. TaxID=1926288 RepID=UPI002B47B2B8|nr:MmgE/PrpD family protein [Noviherbaspirillum sp.]HJV84554.1 MmgE/PrpD family protein [Noviherbaspirillum sp.]